MAQEVHLGPASYFDGLASGAHGYLLVDYLHYLLAAAAASLDSQHGVVESAHDHTSPRIALRI